ncbi:hypothetical protein [Subtercola frigoramans]|uniref:DUF1508 domain-containing protein n=1 Tax=Subtercola frigoramans TaxID=120298 RepID=A0ABS2L532_9MICO|nr:hypothetical protein [Subtercola frigoramans]MBM7472208.1 hypothetical protein [Subtercola frigoramans]
MSASPCIVFSAFRTNSEPMIRAWSAFRQQVKVGEKTTATNTAAQNTAEPTRAQLTLSEPPATRTPSTAAPSQSGIWRLLASNNREVARSSYLYTSFVAARGHVLYLQQSVDDMQITIVNGPTAGTHGWFASIDSSAVMTCARWYGASASSLEAAVTTLAALRSATVTDDPRRTATPGQRNRPLTSTPSRSAAW